MRTAALSLLVVLAPAQSAVGRTNAALGDAFLAQGPAASRASAAQAFSGPTTGIDEAWTEFDMRNYLQRH